MTSFEFTRTPQYDKESEPAFTDGEKYKCACCPGLHVYSAKHDINILDKLWEIMGDKAKDDKYKVRRFKITIEEIQ